MENSRNLWREPPIHGVTEIRAYIEKKNGLPDPKKKAFIVMKEKQQTFIYPMYLGHLLGTKLVDRFINVLYISSGNAVSLNKNM